MRTLLLSLSLVLVGALTSCGQPAPSIEFGKAECAHCRMNVVDRQYAAALITEKGRQYVFDDLACMIHFVDKGTVSEEQVASWYVCDHTHPGTLIDATQALYIHSDAFRSPMRGDVAAFPAKSDAEQAAPGNDLMDWQAARALLAK